MRNYVICPYDKVKSYFPEYQRMMASLHSGLVAKAVADWAPKTFGGMAPNSAQFGETTIIPALFRNDAQTAAGTTTQMATWKQWLGTTGNRTIMSGANTGQIYEDYKIGLAGIAFLDKSINISEVRFQISDRKIGRINIEEAFAYENPAVIFEDGLILDEETGFDLYAYVLSTGYQKIMPIGFQLNRVPNKLMTTETGAQLT